MPSVSGVSQTSLLTSLVSSGQGVWSPELIWVWSYLGGALTSEWVLRPPHGVTGRGVAAWPHSASAVSIFGGQATTLPIAMLLSLLECVSGESWPGAAFADGVFYGARGLQPQF